MTLEALPLNVKQIVFRYLVSLHTIFLIIYDKTGRISFFTVKNDHIRFTICLNSSQKRLYSNSPNH